MKTARFLLSALLLSGAVVFVSCKDAAPVGPSAESAVLMSDSTMFSARGEPERSGLLACTVTSSASARQTIGPSGGVMRIGPHTFTVPAGALRRNVTITAEAPVGRVVRISFEPHGLDFAKPATLEMSYSNCSLLGSLLPKHIAYVSDQLDIYYLLQSVDNLLAKKVTGRVDHFSDYAMAW